MAQVSYSFLDVNAAISGPGGAFSIGSGSGNSEEGIATTNSVINTMVIGADGSGMHSLSANKSGQVIVKLLKTSPTNAQLMAMAQFQRASASTHGQNTITISNLASGDTVTCEGVAFHKIPDIKYAKDGDILEWAFDSIRISPSLGQGI